MAVYPDLCILCGSCRLVCPEEAVSESPILQIDRNLCNACGLCAENCPTTAIRAIGKEYPLDELLEILRRDQHFYEASGGGVTFSGGEPTLHLNYLGDALKELKKEAISTAIQTCGMFNYEDFSRKVLPYADLIMFDIKLIDAAQHRRYTGKDNAVILENFRRLTKEAGNKVLPRIPLIPGITATPDNLRKIASFLADLGYKQCDLLSYNPAGIEKRRAVGMKSSLKLPETPLGWEEEEELRRDFLEQL
jgi:pyruvate formate lyase activating enzyme